MIILKHMLCVSSVCKQVPTMHGQ